MKRFFNTLVQGSLPKLNKIAAIPNYERKDKILGQLDTILTKCPADAVTKKCSEVGIPDLCVGDQLVYMSREIQRLSTAFQLLIMLDFAAENRRRDDVQKDLQLCLNLDFTKQEGKTTFDTIYQKHVLSSGSAGAAAGPRAAAIASVRPAGRAGRAGRAVPRTQWSLSRGPALHHGSGVLRAAAL